MFRYCYYIIVNWLFDLLNFGLAPIKGKFTKWRFVQIEINII